MKPRTPARPALPAGPLAAPLVALPAARLATRRAARLTTAPHDARLATTLTSRLATLVYLAALARLATFATLACLAGLAAATATAAPAAATPYDDGERLQFTGVVTDVGGKPVPGIQVVLEVSRHAFSLRELRRTERDARRFTATTNAQGAYSIEWPWDDYFNRFQVLAGVGVRHGREDRLEILEREDVTGRVPAGSPIVSAIVIHNLAFVDRWREVMASVQSADQRQVYEEMGTPDEVKRVTYAGRREDAEVSFWYFTAGKVYRFHAGRLDQVERFDPVQRF